MSTTVEVRDHKEFSKKQTKRQYKGMMKKRRIHTSSSSIIPLNEGRGMQETLE